MEWNSGTQVFILFIYIIIPMLLILGVFAALILLLRAFLKGKNKK